MVRQAVPADSDAVGDLTARVYRAGGWSDAAYSRLLLDGRSRIEQATVFVALQGAVLAGTVTVARPGTPFAGFCGADEVEVRMLAVDPQARGRGIAGLLMDACEGLARQERFAGVVLSTELDMRAAHRLYERRGYVRRPERDRHIGRFHLLAYRLQT